jgi:hypothetical protein
MQPISGTRPNQTSAGRSFSGIIDSITASPAAAARFATKSILVLSGLAALMWTAYDQAGSPSTIASNATDHPKVDPIVKKVTSVAPSLVAKNSKTTSIDLSSHEVAAEQPKTISPFEPLRVAEHIKKLTELGIAIDVTDTAATTTKLAAKHAQPAYLGSEVAEITNPASVSFGGMPAVVVASVTQKANSSRQKITSVSVGSASRVATTSLESTETNSAASIQTSEQSSSEANNSTPPAAPSYNSAPSEEAGVTTQSAPTVAPHVFTRADFKATLGNSGTLAAYTKLDASTGLDKAVCYLTYGALYNTQTQFLSVLDARSFIQGQRLFVVTESALRAGSNGTEYSLSPSSPIEFTDFIDQWGRTNSIPADKYVVGRFPNTTKQFKLTFDIPEAAKQEIATLSAGSDPVWIAIPSIAGTQFGSSKMILRAPYAGQLSPNLTIAAFPPCRSHSLVNNMGVDITDPLSPAIGFQSATAMGPYESGTEGVHCLQQSLVMNGSNLTLDLQNTDPSSFIAISNIQGSSDLGSSTWENISNSILLAPATDPVNSCVSIATNISTQARAFRRATFEH